MQGLRTAGGNGSAETQSGCGIHWYVANQSMQNRFFYDADGELLIVPQLGCLRLATELGVLEVEPQQIAVIPRGLRFRVELLDSAARGYVCENFGAPFRLPDLGPIGSNGLANPRDFQTPVASYEDREGDFELVAKFLGHCWSARIDHSPLDVVAWHGNHAPYRYDLRRFNTLGSISYDHPDPSIYLVLQSASDTPGVDYHRLRDLSAPLARGGRHLPAALVPPQHRQRVHGTDSRCLRCEGRRLCAGRRVAPQLHERTRSGRNDIRTGEQRGYLAAAAPFGHHGFHDRDADCHPSNSFCTRIAATTARLFGILAKPSPPVHA